MGMRTANVIRRLCFGFRLLARLGFVLIPTSCATYRYIPPTTEAGLRCVTTCEVGHQSCLANVQQDANARADRCDIDRSIKLKECLARATSDSDAQTCNNTANANYCGASAYTLTCDSHYRQCYSACGGTAISEH